MTPMLQAMVEAMIAELKTQSAFILDEDGPNDVLIDGRVDLEAVARAGLAAIREPDNAEQPNALTLSANHGSVDPDAYVEARIKDNGTINILADSPRYTEGGSVTISRADSLRLAAWLIERIGASETASGTQTPENLPKTQNGPQPGAVK
jgi:hypothetical protein